MNKIVVTEEDIYNANPLLKGVMDLAFDESCIMDKDGYIIHCSDSSPLIWGRPNSESIGMHISELDSASPYPKLLETGEAVLGKMHYINGMTCITHMIPLFNAKDEIIGAFGVIIFRGMEKIKQLMRENPFDDDSKFLYNQISRAEAKYSFTDFIGKSDSVRNILNIAKKVTAVDSPVLIRGESGCGKEIISSGIHSGCEARRKRPFVKINCTAIPTELLESELFGYEKGAFSGAYSTKMGKFEIAGNGSILLDEIGSLDSRLQSKLLRVIEEKEFERVGGNTLIPLRARILATTNSNLEQKMKDGFFREDLYYRLSTVEIVIPPLRERKEDIPLLINHFMLLEKLQLNFTANAMQALTRYEWPGNVRQLRNFIMKLGIMGISMVGEGDVRAALNINDSSAAVPAGAETVTARKAQFERDIIVKELRDNAFNISRTAGALGISRNTLYQKISKYGISVNKNVT